MSKKTNNWSMAGYLAGTIYIIATFIHYWFRYPDVNEFLGNLAIGILIIAVSFLYNRDKKRGFVLEAMEEHLADKDFIIRNIERRLKIQNGKPNRKPDSKRA